MDIIDTAVKIGLGAAITSISSLVLSKHNHERDSKKDRIKREREILEKVAEEFETFSYSVLSFWALITEWNHCKTHGKDLSPERRILLDEAKRDYFLKSKDLTSAEAKLLLLGQGEVQRALREYADLLREFRKKVYERDQAYERNEMEEWREKILTSRKRFFEILSYAFLNL